MSTMSFSKVRTAMGLVAGLSSRRPVDLLQQRSLVHTTDASRAACAMQASR